MDFDSAVTSFKHQLEVVWDAPIPFVLCVAAAALVIWKALDWRYGAIVDRLRSDVEHLARVTPATDKRSRQPRQATSSKKPKSYPASDKASGVREFLPETITPDFLGKMRRDLTGAQADKLMQEYIGKWIKATGYVVRTGIHDEQSFVAIVPDPGLNLIAYEDMIHLSFDGVPTNIVGLKEGDLISCVGELRRADGLGIMLQHCEQV